MASVHRLCSQFQLPPWAPAPGDTVAATKRSLKRYRDEIVKPAVLASMGAPPGSPPLPWAWIALNARNHFTEVAFTLWWQIRLLGQPCPARPCPWCSPATPLTITHLQLACPTFATACLSAGLLPAETFNYPSQAEWFVAVLAIIHTVAAAGQG